MIKMMKMKMTACVKPLQLTLMPKNKMLLLLKREEDGVDEMHNDVNVSDSEATVV